VEVPTEQPRSAMHIINTQLTATNPTLVGRRGQNVRLLVHKQSVCPQHKNKDPKLFKLGIGNELGMS